MTDQDFDLTGANAHFEAAIQLDKPVGDVVLQSHLTIEDNIEQLSFVNGILREDDGLNVLRFDPGVTTGCNGGNNNSYASGQVQKHGAGNVMLPMGDGGVFAPAGIQAMIWMDQLQLLVKVILTVMRSATPLICSHCSPVLAAHQGVFMTLQVMIRQTQRTCLTSYAVWNNVLACGIHQRRTRCQMSGVGWTCYIRHLTCILPLGLKP